MSSIDEEWERDSHEAWVSLPITKVKRDEIKRSRYAALQRLLQAANASSDPDVRDACATFYRCDADVVILGGDRFLDEVKRGKVDSVGR